MNNFQSNIISIYGDYGKSWLDNLPQLVKQISIAFNLKELKELHNLTYNFVLSGLQGNTPIILKLGLDNEALKREALTLKCFANVGVVKLLAEDKGMLLLEKQYLEHLSKVISQKKKLNQSKLLVS
jgi:streptomycin 6-kinase